jgi:hypothetical protein
VLLRLFALSIFLSAAALFLVEPLVGKILLPTAGGSPAVWNTCMVFFQAMLLAAYGYAHLSTKYLSPRVQGLVHLALVVVAGATLPIPIEVGAPGQADPTGWVLLTMTVACGLPFFVISSTAPLLQRWFSNTDHPDAKDPYFLYAASNAGSMVGLILYPLLVDPLMSRHLQSWAWTGLYWVIGPLVIACAVVMLGRLKPAIAAVSDPDEPRAVGSVWKERGLWLVLAFIPSSLLLGVTQYLTTDLAPIPLLWIVPLVLYLLSFIVAFSTRINASSQFWGRVMLFCAVAVMMAMLLMRNDPMSVLATIHLVTFFVASVMCHRRMVELRPKASRLTEFYFIMSLGGVCGGAFNAIAAPLLFNNLLEYPLMIGAACLMRPQVISDGEGLSRWREFRRWAVAIVCGLIFFVCFLNLDAALQAGVFRRAHLVGSLRLEGGELKMGSSKILDKLGVIGVVRAGIPVFLCLLLSMRRGSLRFGLSALGLLVASVFYTEGGTLLAETRSFFGVNKVTMFRDRTWVKLTHGTTVHGLQARNYSESTGAIVEPPRLNSEERYKLLFQTNRNPEWLKANYNLLPLIPTSYYHPSGPIGEIFGMLTREGRNESAALVGLGAGTLAAYASANSRFTFYEIDAQVIRLASPANGPYEMNYFTFIADAVRDPTVKIGHRQGDGRILLQDAPEEPSYVGPFDLIVLDAFSSDAIPVHLLTKEAIEIYLRNIKDNGIIAFHISNRYFDLRRPLQRIAHELGLIVYVRDDSVVTSQLLAEGKRESLWLTIVRKKEAMGALAKLPNWQLAPEEREFPLWTDDHANLLGTLIELNRR